MAAAPDAVVVGGSGSPAATPQIALVEQGYKGPIYHNHGTVNLPFIQTGKKAAEGAIAPTGALIVAEELPADFPTKAVSLDFVKRYEAAFGAGSRNAFAGYTYDGVLLLDAAAAVALKKAKPGTPEFREALRDALENLKNVVGTHGVYNMTPGQPQRPGRARARAGAGVERRVAAVEVSERARPPADRRRPPQRTQT